MNLRLLALGGLAVCAVALPLAAASAEQPEGEGRTVAPAGAREAAYGDRSGPASGDRSGSASGRGPATGAGDGKAPTARTPGSPLLLGLGVATAARCGPELSTPGGIEAQTCVLAQGEETWARTYFRNATGRDLEAVLSLMGPQGRTMQMHCRIGSEDEPGTCETPRERTRGAMDAYTAVAEFARADGGGPLLLRSGSNSPMHTGN
ncbi:MULTISPECIES: hypothetical protein [unclassified Streptomyces]|uniref:hypothetical protein n=1 Tax=unclassified Streptomyces TaxID=2593676 RepID=UPI001F03D918|nr:MULTISPECIES: hypothetical protein [unclassified Streptomyces]MCH0564477.1 hypothetical protein [Streptomyces sp. MUM 2J]MCH0569310.1 hypothetical protein [Streptomyces sp. MUM 136J]